MVTYNDLKDLKEVHFDTSKYVKIWENEYDYNFRVLSDLKYNSISSIYHYEDKVIIWYRDTSNWRMKEEYAHVDFVKEDVYDKVKNLNSKLNTARKLKKFIKETNDK